MKLNITYADDVVIFADIFDTLKYAMLIFNEQSQILGATCQVVQYQASNLQRTAQEDAHHSAGLTKSSKRP